ncbi:hypothetical protein RGQ29_017545 [Quercus rubra]|nr:hypothetical protein RGQ29_017545 [Quercus rubra]
MKWTYVKKGSLFMVKFMQIDMKTKLTIRKTYMMTKLRPFICSFLKEESEMFEMYIYAMGDRLYWKWLSCLIL